MVRACHREVGGEKLLRDRRKRRCRVGHLHTGGDYGAKCAFMSVVRPRVVRTLLFRMLAAVLSLCSCGTLLENRIDPRRDGQRSCLPDGEDEGECPEAKIEVHGVMVS